MQAQLETPERRLDGYLKVTGGARYAADFHPPGTLWAVFLPSPLAHARILRIDTTRASALPGVHAVLTGADIGPIYIGRILKDWPVLAVDRVRFVGERVAAVAAETRAIAAEAVSLIEVEYEELPGVFDPRDALRPDAPVLHPDPGPYVHSPGPRPPRDHANLQGYRLVESGASDLAPLFAQCDLVVEEEYFVARQHPGFIEPRACVVWFDDDGTVRVHSAHKGPFEVREEIAAAGGHPLDRVVVDSQFLGGDFGGKNLCILEIPCYLLARATGRPVKAVLSYAEELGATNPRPSSLTLLKTGVTRDGRIVAHESKVYYDGGAYAAGRVLPGPMLDGWTVLEPYRVPNARRETFLVYTNLVPGGQNRAPGAAAAGFAGEQHVDEIARRLGMDPIEFRLRNAVRDGDVLARGEHVRQSRAVEVLEALQAEMKRTEQAPAPNRGRGISFRTRHIGEGRAQVTLRLLANGTFEALHSTAEQGGGTATVIQRVAAASLGVDQDRVVVRYGTTAEALPIPGPGASRTTRIVGRATQAAATQLKKQVEDLATEVRGWPAGRVHLRGERLEVDDGSGESASLDELLPSLGLRQPLEVKGAYDAAVEEAGEEKDFNFSAVMVEVEVDPESGQVRPIDALLVVDVGAIVNPVAFSGQLDGGFVYGLGGALLEDLRVDDGRVSTLSLGDYKLPGQKDLPPFRVVMVPGSTGPGPFGAKSVGENVNNAVPPAVANAVVNAVGARVYRMPLAAESVLQALGASDRLAKQSVGLSD